MIVALSALSPNNGMLIFCRPPEEEHSVMHSGWQEEEITLEAGDAVIWRGECLAKRGNGDGGVILLILYQSTTADR